MGRRKNSGAGGSALVIIGVLVALLAMIPKAVWFGLVALVAAWLLFKVLGGSKKQSVADEIVPAGSTADRSSPSAAMSVAHSMAPSGAFNIEPQAPVSMAKESRREGAVSARLRSEMDEPVCVATASPPATRAEFKLPSGPKHFGPGTWIPHGTAVEVAGITIPGGMVYVGTTLQTPGSRNDPCLIDPSKAVASQGDYTERQMGYWPSYSEISSSARRAYLNWLADGRSDPNADIGYVFIFFYGLERRAIIDANTDVSAMEDWQAIANELRRLLSIYGDKSGSFRSYASELLNWVSLSKDTKLYQRPVPDLIKSFELPPYLKLALGQAAFDGAPLPAPLALAWVKFDPNYYPRTAATRCAAELDALFEKRYRERYGAGLVIPKNRTKLKFVYRPASAGFHGFNEIKLSFGETPDVSVLTKPIKEIRAIVDAVTDDLDGYSRFVGRNPEARGALEGLLFLPPYLWPSSTRQAMDDLKARVFQAPVSMAYQELLTLLGAKASLNKDRAQALARALGTMSMGFEPDVLGTARLPRPEEPVILFDMPVDDDPPRAAPAYQAALLTLQLASSVAAADGDFGESEMDHLKTQVQAWVHLTPSHQRRLVAHLHLLLAVPVPLTSLKKRLEALDASAKESIASFMAILAQADGTVSPQEVKVLEKVYKILGLDPKKVFSDLHAASARDAIESSSTQASASAAGFKLDTARIAALQQDTAKVSALLASIFTEEAVEQTSALPQAPIIEPEPEVDQAEGTSPALLLGLDETHASLARLLLTRTYWTREELQDVAADLDLMLDGALERINEASFDAHDIPFIEGDDPIEVNNEVREKIEA